jgi:micrococcal nuclease
MKTLYVVLLIILFSGCIQESGYYNELKKSETPDVPTDTPANEIEQTTETPDEARIITPEPSISETHEETQTPDEITYIKETQIEKPETEESGTWPPKKKTTSFVLTSTTTNNETHLEAGVRYDVLVLDVINGDILEVKLPDGLTKRIKLLGIEVPETLPSANNLHFFDDIVDLECLAEYGDSAKKYTTNLLNGKTCIIELDSMVSQEEGGNLLAYVYKDDVEVNRYLIEAGYAIVTPQDYSKKQSYLQTQDSAKEELKGIWSCSVLEDYSITAELTVGFLRIHYDAEGNDDSNLIDEYVEIKNYGDAVVSLSNWTISDSGGNSFVLPDIYLNPGEMLSIHTGIGVNTETNFYLKSHRQIWDNEEDAVYLYNSAGELVDYCEW